MSLFIKTKFKFKFKRFMLNFSGTIGKKFTWFMIQVDRGK